MAADLPAEPFNREEEYLADIAGQNVEVPPCPWNRKEAYLAEIGGRLDDMDDRIAALATDLSFKGSVATESDLPTGAATGDTYITEDTGVMYVWTGTDWTALGGTGITVVDQPGTSTTDAMSQKAATALVYRMNSGGSYSDHAIKIGGGASTDNNGVSIGYQASLSGGVQSVAVGSNAKSVGYGVAIGSTAKIGSGNYGIAIGYLSGGQSVQTGGSVMIGRSATVTSGVNHAIALGDFSKATRTGEFNIGTPGSSGNGYNNTDYRLLTGVHDPVNAHDAATKGYVDAAVSGGGGGVTVLYVNGQDFGVNKSGSQIYVYKESSLTNKYSGSELYTLASANTDFVIRSINADGTANIYRAFYVGLPSANTDEAFDEDGNFYIVSRYPYGGRDIGLAIMSVDTEYISVYVS